MEKKTVEKSYEVSELTKMVLDCKLMNAQLYSMIYDVVNHFYSSESDAIMENKLLDAHNQIDDFLSEYLGISVNENLSETSNIKGEKVRI